MMSNSNFKSESSGQTIILAGFVIAVIIVGLGTILNSVAISGQQSSPQQSDESFDYFNNVREEYGNALMISSDHGDFNPFNATLILEFEDRMKTIMESHGIFINFTWTNDSYYVDSKRASVNILFSDGNKFFNDTVTYNLVTGKIIYDTIPPGDIVDLYVKSYDNLFDCDDDVDGAIILNWTATGDDGDQGTASRYDIRYSNESIADLFKFKNATQYNLGTNPKASGQLEDHIIYLLPPGDWYFAMIVYDEAGNPSNLTRPVDSFNHAEASEWSPEIDNLSADNLSSDNKYPFFDATINDDINITFQVNDRDPGDNVTISLWVRNRTLNPDDTWDEGNWFEDKTWSMGNYSGIELFYDNITGIDKSWDYYFNLTDDSSCDKKRSYPFGAPDNYYSIEIQFGDRILINSSDDVMDAYIDINNPNDNYGNNLTIDTYESEKYGLIWFNLSSIPTGSNIEYAELSLYINSSANNIEMNLYSINSSWDEYLVNWNIQPSSNYPISSIPDEAISFGGVFIHLNVTADVQNYLINRSVSWQIRSLNNNEYAYLDSKEATNASRHPSLYVMYE